MLSLPNYQIVSQIYESANSLVYRGHRKTDNQPVILKMLKLDYPTPAELTRYRQEYEITRDLDLTGVIKVYGIEKYQHRLVIILEDFGGESLKQLMANRPFTLKEFLPIANQIADSLGHIHAAHIIHKDINPSNIVWEPVSKQLKIIDFGIASLLARENPTFKNPEQLEGTLAYLSPEQTGRINRNVDYRTDLYSLGVTFYEMLTGQLPFEALDAMELVHGHLAKTPTPLREVNPDIPSVISALVMKLMAKNAEQRYQSAFGVKADLQECFFQVEKNAQIQFFQLAQNDFSGKLQIPQKLYGRESEINTLLQAFERVSQGNVEMMLVAGYSGVGKTALVHEIHKPMTLRNGYFATGKFDQFQKNIPYFAIAQAFNKFCRYLLMENRETFANWQTKILAAMGNNGQIIIDVIPDLELVIGKQPLVAKLAPTETQNRFQIFFLNFVKALCNKDHPFILFIDDLQWVDSASLGLLKSIMLDDEIRHLLIIGAYRDNEVDNTHPLIMMVDELKKTNAVISTIKLANLLSKDINNLLQETLNCEAVQSLADLIGQKTQGNAFFTHQFLKNLYENKWLQFNFEQHQWHWDVQQITAQNITDNVIDLMANKISQLPEKTAKALQLAAGIGNQFDLALLAIIFGQDHQETGSVLHPALTEGLIQSLDDNYKQIETAAKSQFKFLHDRVQQAAYSLIPEEKKKEIHLKIGQQLLENTSEKDIEELIFDVTGHLNSAQELITEQDKQIELAKLNLVAGKKAKQSTAYNSAQKYLTTGLKLTKGKEDVWKNFYELIFELYRESGEVEYLLGNHERCDQLLNTALEKAHSKLDKAEIHTIKIPLLTKQGQFDETINEAIEALNLFGMQLPAITDLKRLQQVTEAETALYSENIKKTPIKDLINLPINNDIETSMCFKIFNMALDAAILGVPEWMPLFATKAVNMSINNGLSQFIPTSYCFFAALQGGSKNLSAAFLFADIARQINEEKLPYPGISSKVYHMYAHFATLRNPYKKSLEYLNKGYQIGLEMGDLVYAGYHLGRLLEYHYPFNLEKAAQVEQKANEFYLNDPVFLSFSNLRMSFVKALQGNTIGSGNLDNSDFSTEKFTTDFAELPLFMAEYKRWQILAYYFFDRYQAAEPIAYERQHWINVVGNVMISYRADFYLFSGLTVTRLYDPQNPKPRNDSAALLQECLFELEQLNEQNEENFSHFYQLLKAETAKIEKNDEAMDYYLNAIKLAKQHEFLRNECLANELFARFWLQKGLSQVAAIYMTEARYLYEKWGATAKVKQLNEKYPQLFKSERQGPLETSATTTFFINYTTVLSTGTVSCFLDLNSILKASQTLSSEIVLSHLLNKLMHIVIENAGAERGLLILEKEKGQSEWVIEAEGRLNVNEVIVLQSLSLDGNLPISIINYVVRACEPVVLANARQEGIYTQDNYIRQHQLKSVLCSPILLQQHKIGLLYLENNLIEGTFTPARLRVLEMLSSQAAISLENALLYRTLEQKVEERTEQLSKANQQIMLLNKRLKQDNLRMSAELDVARQLQQMVLPKAPELQQIEELDIAGFMEPADEVGGDYYDVLEQEGRIKIGIGDVTGHGLESGVLMLMVQTAVRSLLVSETTEPTQFLTVLNRIIYDNQQRMKSDKNLTLSLLDYHQGTLQLTGQHEEVLLVRQNGEVERIDTFELGYSVGVVVDIADWVAQTEIFLQPGDGMVLYTDGMTKARNCKNQLYTVERLCEVISRDWHLSAQEILNVVIADVRQHIGTQKVYDDITLLILKQK